VGPGRRGEGRVMYNICLLSGLLDPKKGNAIVAAAKEVTSSLSFSNIATLSETHMYTNISAHASVRVGTVIWQTHSKANANSHN
jgi:hypothetical protein